MISFLPKQISSRAIYLYLGSLAAVSIVFRSHAMQPVFILLGIMWVVGFFLLVSHFSQRWRKLEQPALHWTLFLTALGLRWAWVVFSFFFYMAKTGAPFEFSAADSLAYWDESLWLSQSKWATIRDYLFTSRNTVSDSGYLLYLTYLCKVIGTGIVSVRLFNAILSAASVLLVYHLAKRNIGEEGGRMAAVMTCFMPNLIYYCGLHLKETVMIFLIVAFLERTDYLIRAKRYNVLTIAVPVLLLLSLFTFRTVLGITGAFALATGLLFTNQRIIGRTKRILLIVWGVLAVTYLWGGTIRAEVESTWDDREMNQETKRQSQTQRGNQWAKYATGTVMAPLMFILPFPTMVDVDEQYNQQVISGGNYVRTFLGGFVLLALFSTIFVKKNWRELSFLGSFVIGYLGILSASGFSNSERFLLPALPGLLIMASYGITVLDAKNYRFIKIWYYVVPVMIVGWAFFKLGSRGIL